MKRNVSLLFPVSHPHPPAGVTFSSLPHSTSLQNPWFIQFLPFSPKSQLHLEASFKPSVLGNFGRGFSSSTFINKYASFLSLAWLLLKAYLQPMITFTTALSLYSVLPKMHPTQDIVKGQRREESPSRPQVTCTKKWGEQSPANLLRTCGWHPERLREEVTFFKCDIYAQCCAIYRQIA